MAMATVTAKPPFRTDSPPTVQPSVTTRLRIGFLVLVTLLLAVSVLGEDAVLRGAVATGLEVARERVFLRSPVRQMQEVAG